MASGALGLGALCYYGMGLSDKPGAVEVSMLVFVVNSVLVFCSLNKFLGYGPNMLKIELEILIYISGAQLPLRQGVRPLLLDLQLL